MYADIADALGSTHGMWYHAQWPSQQLVPGCDLDTCLRRANDLLRMHGNALHHLSAGDQDLMANLVRINWFCHQLTSEPIRKPILAHLYQGQLIVDCGDTRLMALSALGQCRPVKVIATAPLKFSHEFVDWTLISNNQELLAAAQLPANSPIYYRTQGHDPIISWIEFALEDTAHHLHDVDQRLTMMQSYLQHQNAAFQFDLTWAASKIDWSAFDLSAATNR